MRIALFLLRLLPPEISHSIALNALNFLYKYNLISILFPYEDSSESFEFKGLIFKNRPCMRAPVVFVGVRSIKIT